MEGNAFVFRHWDDVVFENRNKTYGAYLLRRAYSKRLLFGVGITITTVTILLLLQGSCTDGRMPFTAPPLADGGHILLPPPVIPRPQPPQNAVHRAAANTMHRPVVVTREPVTDEPEHQETEVVFTEGTEGNGAINIIESTGTGVIPEVAPSVPRVRDYAEVMPRYEGGLEAMMKFIRKKIHYPATPKRLNIDGTVYVRFVVNGDGTVSNVEILKGVHPDYDKEAIRVVSMLPSWIGGKHNGDPVPVRMVLPIKFNLTK
jgi:protein TonB